MFLPGKPFLVPGSLRQQLVYRHPEKVSDRRLLKVMDEVGLEQIMERVGGLDSDCDWDNLLSLGDQQLLVAARLILAAPTFAFLDEATSALDESRTRRLYETLSRTEITYISAGTDLALADYHDEILELHGDGTWRRSTKQVLGVSSALNPDRDP